jgi:hypothetical protein
MMELLRLQGEQYVRLTPEAARAVAPYVGAAPAEIEELLVEVEAWPEAIRPHPRRGRDGKLIAGDPLLLDANEDGLIFASASTKNGVLIPWKAVAAMQVLRPAHWAGA